VEVLAVKPFLENLRTFHLIDVGLIGNNRLKITENDCLFSSLKFLTTSYNHKEAKFHLTISLVQKDPEGPPVYLKSVISPPIFVDSRKSARNPMDLKKRHLKPFVEKFPMESLRRPYMKKEKKNLQIIENHIENSLKGLYDYLTAPNIRDKVKNPLFLAMKFPACVRLFYDSEKIHGVLLGFSFFLSNLLLGKARKRHGWVLYNSEKILHEKNKHFQTKPFSLKYPIPRVRSGPFLYKKGKILEFFLIIFQFLIRSWNFMRSLKGLHWKWFPSWIQFLTISRL